MEKLWPAAALGVSLAHPDGWRVNAHALALGGPLSFDNFLGQAEHGGLPPEGGAITSITSRPMPARPFEQVIMLDQAPWGIDSRANVTVGDLPAVRGSDHRQYTPGTGDKRIIVYIPRGVMLTKIFLNYNAGEPNEPQLVAAFDAILASVQFGPTG
jgi:hypothetical protein